jgi:hypothetical protein
MRVRETLERARWFQSLLLLCVHAWASHFSHRHVMEEAQELRSDAPSVQTFGH